VPPGTSPHPAPTGGVRKEALAGLEGILPGTGGHTCVSTPHPAGEGDRQQPGYAEMAPPAITSAALAPGVHWTTVIVIRESDMYGVPCGLEFHRPQKAEVSARRPFSFFSLFCYFVLLRFFPGCLFPVIAPYLSISTHTPSKDTQCPVLSQTIVLLLGRPRVAVFVPFILPQREKGSLSLHLFFLPSCIESSCQEEAHHTRTTHAHPLFFYLNLYSHPSAHMSTCRSQAFATSSPGWKRS